MEDEVYAELHTPYCFPVLKTWKFLHTPAVAVVYMIECMEFGGLEVCLFIEVYWRLW